MWMTKPKFQNVQMKYLFENLLPKTNWFNLRLPFFPLIHDCTLCYMGKPYCDKTLSLQTSYPRLLLRWIGNISVQQWVFLCKNNKYKNCNNTHHGLLIGDWTFLDLSLFLSVLSDVKSYGSVKLYITSFSCRGKRTSIMSYTGKA